MLIIKFGDTRKCPCLPEILDQLLLVEPLTKKMSCIPVSLVWVIL